VIELELVGVRVELPHNQPIVLLKERTGERFLPIWIGAVEATSIAFALQGVVTAAADDPRPHARLARESRGRGRTCRRHQLHEGTFYAEIQMTQDGEVRWSCRHALRRDRAGGARDGADLRRRVRARRGRHRDRDDDEDEVERFKEFLDSVTP
jgi:uncharacterized protein